jgi:hypothetical protein
MSKCEVCGKEIDSKYKFCIACSQKLKEEKTDRGFSDSGEVVKAIQQVNNNLYFIRTALAFVIKKKYRTEIIWDSESKTFKEKGKK